MTENPRTTSARDHDDHALIDDAVDQSAGGGQAGAVTGGGKGAGALTRDVGSADDLARAVADPEAHGRVGKQADVDANVARPAARNGGDA